MPDLLSPRGAHDDVGHPRCRHCGRDPHDCRHPFGPITPELRAWAGDILDQTRGPAPLQFVRIDAGAAVVWKHPVWPEVASVSDCAGIDANDTVEVCSTKLHLVGPRWFGGERHMARVGRCVHGFVWFDGSERLAREWAKEAE